MKTILSFQRVALAALALGTVSITSTFAQSTNTSTGTPPTCSAGGKHHHHDSVLTSDEKAQLDAARDKAFVADPTLKTEETSLKSQFESLKAEGKGAATKDQWKALHEQKKDFEEKLHAAELKIDPTLAPIFAKLEAAHTHGHHSS